MGKVKIIFAVILALIFYILSPFILIILALPISILRLAAKLSKVFMKKDLGKMVSPLSNLFGVDKVYESPTGNLILGSVYEGTISKELVCQVVTEKWLNKRDSLGKEFYPELRQGLTTWLGFTFWKNDNQFNVLNHVRILEVKGDNFTKGDVRTLVVNLINSPFEESRSLWEIVIVPNYKSSNDRNCEMGEGSQTLVLFKIHHTLIDGFSMLNLGEQVLENCQVPTHRMSNNLDHYDHTFLAKLMAILRMPYFIAKMLLNTKVLIQSRNGFPGQISREVAFFNFSKIGLADLKELKVMYGVSVSSLLLAGYAAGIKSILEESRKFDLLKEVQCVIPVPLPGHPEKLRNHMSFVLLDLPINESCPKKRLMSINESLDQARKSLNILTMFYLLRWIGSSPSWIIRQFVRNSPVPFLLTNFPGPSLPLVVEGHRCKEIFFSGGLLDGHLHAICSCIGYDQNVYMGFVTDEYFQNLTDEVEMEQVLDKILDELKSLKRLRNYV